jgi:Mg2+ and Co2+ transporter CorA
MENNTTQNDTGIELKNQAGFQIFPKLQEFKKAVEAEAGIIFDFDSVVDLTTDFAESGVDYLILNLKEPVQEEQLNNLLFLTEKKVFIFAKNFKFNEQAKLYQDVLSKPFGLSTILTFVVITKVLDSYKKRLESLINEIKTLYANFKLDKYHDVLNEFEQHNDRLEDFADLVLRLQERCYQEVVTEYISFDYRVLITEGNALQARYRRRLGQLRGLRQDYETQATSELNFKIAKLNDIVRRLTAITVILMLPTLIASHFGMNFTFMPELNVPWAYPALIVFQVVIVAVGIILFRKIGWL